MGTYELSLSPEYVTNWTVTDAVRELFQNALDQQIQNPANLMFMNYNDGILTIGNKFSSLDTSSLLLGHSTKRHDEATIGQFGEGYKVGVLVLLREHKVVTFYNYGQREVWKPRLVKSRKYKGATILVFGTVKQHFWNPVPDNDLTITVEGITEDEYADIVANNLHCQQLKGDIIEVPQGRILLDPEYARKVFVNGLFVKDFASYKYGYDFMPKHIKLNRDRKLVSDFELTWLASKMWAESDSPIKFELLKAGAGDVACLESFTYVRSTIHDDAYSLFKKEHGAKAVPVTTQEDIDEVKERYVDAVPIVVPESYRHTIKKSLTYSNTIAQMEMKPKETTKEALLTWYEHVKENLDSCDRLDFESIVSELDY